MKWLLNIALALVCLCAPIWAFAAGESSSENSVDTSQLPDSSFIYDTSIDDLASANMYYNKQTVQVVGEVIGDRIADSQSGDHCWVTLASTDAKTVSVYTTYDVAEKIDAFGKYGVKGSTLQVRGVFNLSCTEHEGASDIHAEVVTITEKGKATPDTFDADAFVPGVVAIILGLALMVVFYVLRERQR